MKNKSNAFWLISSIALAIAALWGAVAELSDVMGVSTVCGIVLIVFAVVSILAAFTYGIKSNGSGWLLTEGLVTFCLGLSYMFSYVDYSLFTVDLVLIMGLWLMFLGISQIVRMNKKSKSFGRVLAVFTGVLAVMSGLSLYIKPVAEVLSFAKGGALQVYSVTFQFLIATFLVLSRLAIKDAKK